MLLVFLDALTGFEDGFGVGFVDGFVDGFVKMDLIGAVWLQDFRTGVLFLLGEIQAAT
jgi:hypothetical protein